MRRADISVIVPCYDTRRYLGEALESALAQRPAPAEVIVVDDGSTDGSPEIAESFGERVRCHRTSHRGISPARNTGLALARGALVAFLDADDVWTTDSLACRLEALEAGNRPECAAGLVEQFVSPELPDDVRQALACPPGTSRGRLAGALLVRREVFERVGSFEETLRVGETLDWVARADAAGVVTCTVERVVLRRRLHDANTGTRERDLRADYLRVLKGSLDRRRAAADRSAGPPPGTGERSA